MAFSLPSDTLTLAILSHSGEKTKALLLRNNSGRVVVATVGCQGLSSLGWVIHVKPIKHNNNILADLCSKDGFSQKTAVRDVGVFVFFGRRTDICFLGLFPSGDVTGASLNIPPPCKQIGKQQANELPRADFSRSREQGRAQRPEEAGARSLRLRSLQKMILRN
jgi:hypothetical protein